MLHDTGKITQISGATLVEFALIAPIFMLMLFVLIELGNILYSKQILIYAVREGARILALKNASINQAEKIVKENLSNNGFDTRKITLLSYDNDPSCKKNISTIHMEVKIPIQDILITGDPFGIFINKKFLFASTDMKKECIRKYEKK